MISLEAARDAVAAYVEPLYRGPGTFYVSDFGFVGHGVALFYIGAREWLVDRDRSFLTVGAPVFFVDLSTGVVTPKTYLDSRDLIDDMDRFGDWPEE